MSSTVRQLRPLWSEFVIANPGVLSDLHIVDIVTMPLGDLNDSYGHTHDHPHYIRTLSRTLSGHSCYDSNTSSHTVCKSWSLNSDAEQIVLTPLEISTGDKSINQTQIWVHNERFCYATSLFVGNRDD
ncbi:unnamed protein product [Hymenolepis diminuta]|uniref:Uncharacterized protein n=1 Tax=Hymenolepis diminuta TaxID=6216 RepID=A0A564YVQ0_HYMDI|nr:unnamed protein product [Hymenolepis diminuta]